MSLFQQLSARRVPQILGLYVAGTWMAIEIGDWLIEKFGLPTSLTAYIFIGLAVLLPSVALVAWGHGAPGKDHWSRSEKVFVPLNLAAAAVALFFLGPQQASKPDPVTTAKATETRTIVDETGADQSFEVPVEAFHKNITVFFFDNQTGDTRYDWLSYGLPTLVAYDLNHETPLATVTTPFGSDPLKETLRIRGYDNAVGEPRSLQITIARNNRSDAMLGGSMVMVDDTPTARLELIDIESGTSLATITQSLEEPLLTIADRISLTAQRELAIDPRSDEENDPLTDNLTADADALRNYVDGRIAVKLRNDYPAGIAAALSRAIERDATFAAAHGALGNLLYLSGDASAALASVKRALAHDYKLSTAHRFLYRAQRYLYDNDYARTIKVLEMWTQVDRLNPASHELLGTILLLSGQTPDRAMAALRQSLKLNPGNHQLYSSMATVEQGRGNLAAAAQLIQSYIEARPEDEKAHLQLAMLYATANDFDNARKAYMDAELVSLDDPGASLGLASLALRTGDFEQARHRIDQVLARSLTPQQRVQALNRLAELQYVRGDMTGMLTTLEQLDETAEQFMPPVLRAIQIGMYVVNAETLLGRFDDARDTIEALRENMDAGIQGFFHVPLLGLYWEEGQRDKALEQLELAEAFAAARADPSYDSMIAYARVFRAVANNDVDGVIAQVGTTLELLDKSFLSSVNTSAVLLELRVDLARLLREMGALDTAQELLAKTLTSSPALPTAHLEMAHIWHDLEKPGEARKSLDKALSVWSSADAEYLRLIDAQSLRVALRN